jgi:hypothetical protein
MGPPVRLEGLDRIVRDRLPAATQPVAQPAGQGPQSPGVIREALGLSLLDDLNRVLDVA